MVSIGKRIEDLREKREFTGKALADAVGMGQGYLSEIINGKKDAEKLAVGTFMRLCEALQTTPEFLYYEEGDEMNSARTGLEAQILMLFRAVPEDRRELILDLLKTAAHSGNENAL